MINIDLTNFQRIENVNEMEYFSPDRNDFFKVLASGCYKWHNFKIVSRSYYPLIYIRVSELYSWYLSYIGTEHIEVHGGITFNKMVLDSLFLENGCWWIGWDYNQPGDDFGDWGTGKRYTTEELLNDMMAAVDQLVNL